jgi:D-xylose transport system permease protein
MAPESAANSLMLIGQGYLPTWSPAEEGQVHDTSLYLSLVLIAATVFAGMRRRAARTRYGFDVLPLRFEVARLVLVSSATAAFALIMVIYAGIPWSVIWVIVLALIFSFLTNNTTFGRHLYAIGGNPDAARLSGINVPRKTLLLFVIMGVMTAVAGIVYTARLNAATTSAGQNAELDAIAAAVIGGTSLMGGEGTISGAVIGALVMASLDNGMSLMNLDITFQYVIKGLILLFAVWIDMAQRKKS